MNSLSWDNSDCWYPHIWVFPDDALSLVASLVWVLDFPTFDKLDIQASVLGIGVHKVYHLGALMLPGTGPLPETRQSKYTLAAVGQTVVEYRKQDG